MGLLAERLCPLKPLEGKCARVEDSSLSKQTSGVKRRSGLIWLRTGVFMGALIIGFCGFSITARAETPEAKGYVGSSACMACHKPEYDRFVETSRKSTSFQSILRMKKGLSSEEIKGCYACHTTGYGKPGGFVSIEQTPELKDAGCEVCHGPGKLHAETQDPADINKKVSIDVCRQCHTEDRVRAFHYKPVLYGGAH